MTGPQDPAASGRGRLRAGHAEREQAIDTLKAAFVHGQLTKDEFVIRAGQALAARTCADLAALTADIPAAVGSARPPAPARRWPLARAAAGSGGCLIIAAAAVWLAALADPGPPAPTPYHFLAPPCLLIAFSAVLAALGFLVYGVGTSWEQRRSRRQLPPPPRPGGHVPQAGQRGGTGHDGVPPGPRTDRTSTDLRVHKSRRRIPARAGRAPRGVRPAPGAV